ncbi:MAG TPA: SDR family NAD(P)-dependent oxidoreductase, partial [Rhodocyclaceae bacterium]|nr:SDR family NAD(P)-dependent oxidoreductase [Rhodocyclaceae bacterium]
MTTVLITGAARGIGLELCRHYRGRGERVIASCRNSTQALAALGVEVIEGIDVAHAEGAARLREALGDRPLDILINNAGVLVRDALGEIDFDAVA